MKKILCTTAIMLATLSVMAQKDTTQQNTDTIKVGNFVIVKRKGTKGADGKGGFNFSINREKKEKPNISTNWFIFDLGFANYRDKTDYAYAQAGNYLKTLSPSAGDVTKESLQLKTGKSSNVNLWIFMQKLNLSKHIINLKYGLGIEMYNFRFDRNISYRKDPNPFIFNDTIGFSKNKLYAGYATIPLMINFDFTPSNMKRFFTISAGVSAGYLIGSRNKQVSSVRGKIKYKGDFDLDPFRIAAIGEVGLGPIRLYGSYSLNALHNKNTRLLQYPYVIGVRFSNW
ncbi:MAG: PorT family protein [Chitinophagales bacterium]|nr:PorT family protein [Chitinophagales bacterium]